MEGNDGGYTFFVHLRQADDKRLDRVRRALFPRLNKLFAAHAGHACKIRKGSVVRFHRDLHLRHHFGERRAARLRFDAHGRQARGKAKDLRVGKADLGASARQARCHIHNGRFCGSKIVSQIDQSRTEIAHLVLPGAGDVEELGDGLGSLIRHDVGGFSQVDHCLGIISQVFRVNAQLPRRCHDLGDLRSIAGHFKAHVLDGLF